ncbi:MAG: IS1182 family transposase [Dehalococcoidia bacterium]|nr:IS1182 family transposase [Dehalococcoidia bacterium]
MRPYREYTPDQAFLLPPSLTELNPEGDPVFFLREVIQRLDLEAFHKAYRCERGQPPYHPELMVGLYLYGAMRRTYSSRRLAELCQRDVACMYLAGRATPDYHTVGEFRQRFTNELKGLFLQVLVLCREAGLVRLGHVSLDGTKVRANASKHKAMSYARMLQREPILAAEVARWLEEGRREDEAEDAEHGPNDDGWSLPEELKESSRRLEKIRQAKARLEEQAREKAAAEGDDPATAVVAGKAQTNFTDPESRIMHTAEGFQQCYNAQAAVDAEGQVVVACEVSAAAPDVQRLRPMLEQLQENTGQYPAQLSADAGYASEANFAALAEANVHAVIALRRYHRDEPPGTDPAPKRATNRGPYRNQMRERLASPEGKALYKLRKQTVEPVFGQIKGARGFRQFLRRGLTAVEAEWSLVCMAHNVLKLHQASQQLPTA